MTGTELVLVCAAPSEDQLADLDELLGSVVPSLPRLPPKVMVRLTRDEPRRESSGFDQRTADPTAEVEVKLDHLRQRLRQRGIPVILGVAFAR